MDLQITGYAEARVKDREARKDCKDCEARKVPVAPNLAEWIRRIAQGDEAALEALYEATVNRVYGVALRITGQSATAEEVVEEVYFQVWSTARNFDAERGGALTWLLVICRSQALMKLRAEGAVMRHIDSNPLIEGEEVVSAGNQPEHDGRHCDPHTLLSASEQYSSLHSALLRLDGRERQLLALAFFRGLTYGEIAQHMAMPLGTVKSCIRKALSCLRTELERIQ